MKWKQMRPSELVELGCLEDSVSRQLGLSEPDSFHELLHGPLPCADPSVAPDSSCDDGVKFVQEFVLPAKSP